MARPLRLHLPGTLYHVMSRGNDKHAIFTDDRDHERFLELLGRTVERFKVLCLAYCLMKNHYHLLVSPAAFPVSRMMQHLNAAYCQWFNRRHGRVGHVLEGRFTSRHVDTDSYLLTALRYIVMNPVAAELVARPEQWEWSSYRATAGLAATPAFLAVERAWAAFDTVDPAVGRHRFIVFMAAGGPESTLIRAPMVVGGEAFARQITPLLQPHRQTREFAYAERFATRPALETLFLGDMSLQALQEASYDAFLEHAYTLREIGAVVNRAPATVWSWIRSARACRSEAKEEGAGAPGVRSRFFGSQLL